MGSLRLAYLALGGGLLAFGALLIWRGLFRPARPAGWLVRAGLAGALLVAAAGATAAVVLEARAAGPW